MYSRCNLTKCILPVSLIVGVLFAASVPLYAYNLGDTQSHVEVVGGMRARIETKGQTGVNVDDGNISLFSSATAYDAPASDYQHMQQGPVLKSTLPTSLPTLVGEGNYSTNGGVQARAVAGGSIGRGYARAAYSASWLGWIWDGELDWDSYAKGNANPIPGSKSSASGTGWIVDPYCIDWEDEGEIDIELEIEINSQLSSMLANGNVDFSSSSSIDLDNDGTYDQILWSLSYGYDAATFSTYVDFNLGDNCYLNDGLTAQQIEDIINSGWNGNVHQLASDLTFTVTYTLFTDGPGSASFDFNCSTDAENAFERAVPEPMSVVSLISGLLGLGIIRGFRRR